MLPLRTVPSWHLSALTALLLLILGACTYDFEAPFAETPTGSSGGGGSAGGAGGAGGGTPGGSGGTGGSTCADPPAPPAGPTPSDGASNIDASSVTTVDWDDTAGAATYDVYLSDACPPPGYPNDAFQSVTTSELTGQSLSAGVSYCWQVVAVGEEPGCFTVGPLWTFQATGVCSDPSPGPPTVTSVDASYGPGTTSDTYTLTFSEAVTGVGGQVTWTPVVGNGTMGSITPVDGSTYTVGFSGASDSDRYTLTVGTGVTDVCGNPLAGATDIDILIHNDGGLDCEEPADLYSETHYVGSGNHDCWALPAAPQDHTNGHDFSCDGGVGGDVVVAYTTGGAQTTLHYDVAISNYVTPAYLGLEITEPSCQGGASLYCLGNGGPPNDSGSVTVTPSTTYYVWACDGFNNNPRPDIDICLW